MSLITLSMKHGQTQDEAEPARGSGQRGPEPVRGADPARGLERRPNPGSHRRRGVLDRDGGGCAERPCNRRYTDARRTSRRAADRGPQANHAADVSEAVAVRKTSTLLRSDDRPAVGWNSVYAGNSGATLEPQRRMWGWK